jgi:hypothetical protein
MTKNESGGEGHREWFAEQLGDRWASDGPGIYRLVEEPEPPVEPTDDVAGDDLLGALEPPRPVERAPDEPAPRGPRRIRFLRR